MSGQAQDQTPSDPLELEGLSTTEAKARLQQYGPNAEADTHESRLRRLARHFWAPVPWMLEATVALQLAIGQHITATVVAVLLLLNVALGFFQEGRADAAVALLKQKLALRARAKRDGSWVDLPAADLTPDDIVEISLGDVVPADVVILSGSILVDQSMLTGESVPAPAERGKNAYAGGLVRRGEALAKVTATGSRTYFGRTAELVSAAHVQSSEQKAVLGVVRNLTIINFVIVVGIVAYALLIRISVQQIILLVLTALLSAVPVALPATFTLAAALGARTLALTGVLLTRLSALNDAAMIDVLCCDKTGTLTRNEVAVVAVRSLAEAYSEADVVALAATASSTDGQDPIDSAVRAAAKTNATDLEIKVASFRPFDPDAKTAEATALLSGAVVQIIKGAPSAVMAAVKAVMTEAGALELGALERAGYRTLAIAAGPAGSLALIGLISFADPPRADSAELLSELRGLGVTPVMVTGDAPETAASVAHAIGLTGPLCPSGKIPQKVDPAEFAIYSGVFPEQKFKLVKAFQEQGHSVGMCGDGANDAPALRQAQTGIAVSTATDVAKAAAGVVLTEPGLSGIVACIKEGRSAFQRVLTYALTMLVNKCVTLVVLGTGLIITGHAVLTPLLQALSMLTTDFVTMARAADCARPSPYPNAWRVRNLTLAAIPLGLFRLSYLVAVLALGWRVARLDPGQMQTLTFLMLAFAGQGNVYVLRERGRLWSSRPASVMLATSACDLLFVASLAGAGILMAPLPLPIIGALAAATVAFTLIMDSIKLVTFARLKID